MPGRVHRRTLRNEEEEMPLIEISMLTGRDPETKERIIREVTLRKSRNLSHASA